MFQPYLVDVHSFIYHDIAKCVIFSVFRTSPLSRFALHPKRAIARSARLAVENGSEIDAILLQSFSLHYTEIVVSSAGHVADVRAIGQAVY